MPSRTAINQPYEFKGTRTRVLGSALGPYSSDVQEFVSDFGFRKRETVDTPNYRSIHREDLPMNPFKYERVSHSWLQGYLSQTWPDGSTKEESGVLGSPGQYVNLEPRELNEATRNRLCATALAKAQGKIKDQHLNLGVSFGELRSTADLLLDTARRSAVALGAISTGDWKTALGTLWKGDVFDYYGHSVTRGGTIQFYDRRSGNKIGSIKGNGTALADQFLALKFGWMPLYKDLYDSFEHLARVLSDRGFDVRTSASSTHRFNREETEYFEGLPVIRREFGSATCKYTFVYKQAYPDGLLHLKQVGLTNPLSALYQLKSLSFVFDWFLPMGRYLDRLDYDLGLSLTKACKTTFEKTTVRYNVKVAGKVSDVDTYIRAKASKELVTCVRTPITSFPSVPLPRINPNPLGPDRGVSLLALLKQRLKSFRDY